MTNPDTSGMLRFLTDELQDAEDASDRGQSEPSRHRRVIQWLSLVWIIGHVLSGWDGTNPLRNPTNLCEPTHLIV